MSQDSSNNTVSDSNLVVSHQKPSKLEQFLSALPIIGKGKEVVAVLRLEGVIGKAGLGKSGMSASALNSLIEKTFKIDKLKCVCLAINSPGGSPVQSELIASRIIELAKEKDVPVYSFVEDVAASGGYWLACAGDKIFVSRSSIVGSIGVISSGFGFQDAIKKMGVERRVYTQGNNKSVLDPFQPAKDKDVKIIKKIQSEIHDHFMQHVKERRGNRLTQTDNILFSGEFWTGQTAIDFGLADGIFNMHSFIKKKFGENIKVQNMEAKQSWFKKKFGARQASKEIASEIAIETINALEDKAFESKFKLF